MWTIPRISVAAVAVAVVLSGCVATRPLGTAAPKPTPTPIFASDDEALAAATKAYAAYTKMSDQILQEGGKDPERIKKFASRDALKNALSGYSEFRSKQYRSLGRSMIDNEMLQSFSSTASKGEDVVQIYACLDLSQVDVLDQYDASAVSPDRPSRQPFQISFDWVAPARKLLVSAREPWSSDYICRPN